MLALDRGFHSWKPPLEGFPVIGPFDISVVWTLRRGRGEGGCDREAERECAVVLVEIRAFSDAELLDDASK